VSPLSRRSIGGEAKNLKALIAACNRLGWKLTIGHEHFRWFGSWMDDSPVPRQLFATDAEYQACLALGVTERQNLMTAKLAAPTAHIQLPGHDYHVGVYGVGRLAGALALRLLAPHFALVKN
jgi:hypothetical protein